MERMVVYKMRWPKTKYYYFGVCSDFGLRIKVHISLLKSGKHKNRMAQLLFHLYGMPRFAVLHQGSSRGMMKKETSLICSNRKDVFMCNSTLTFGGSEGFYNSKISNIVTKFKQTLYVNTTS